MRRVLALLSLFLATGAAGRALDLAGFIDADGAISVQYRGDTIDPYFAMQALLLAQDNGLDARAPAARWVAWLLPRQKPDATFDRFCRRGPVWAPCKIADADDALHAMWIRTLSIAGARAADPASVVKSRRASEAALARLRDPARGIYLVSPVYPHGLLMDNVEVWHHAARREPALARAIDATFWDGDRKQYRYSTQEASAADAFYPDAVAQLYPMLLGFPRHPHAYPEWMKRHRARWLQGTHEDFAWGVLALVAWRAHDAASAGCWLREVEPERHGPHWIVTDEVVLQVLQAEGARAASPSAECA